MQALSDLHDTAVSWVEPVRFTSGTRWIVHVEPSQRSASANCDALLPTAVHERGEVHETAVSWFQLATLTVGMTRQDDPFHRSAKVLSLAVGPGIAPTP
jgi:hypothetical protein